MVAILTLIRSSGLLRRSVSEFRSWSRFAMLQDVKKFRGQPSAYPRSHRARPRQLLGDSNCTGKRVTGRCHIPIRKRCKVSIENLERGAKDILTSPAGGQLLQMIPNGLLDRVPNRTLSSSTKGRKDLMFLLHGGERGVHRSWF